MKISDRFQLGFIVRIFVKQKEFHQRNFFSSLHACQHGVVLRVSDQNLVDPDSNLYSAVEDFWMTLGHTHSIHRIAVRIKWRKDNVVCQLGSPWGIN